MLVTHGLDQVADLCDRAIVLENGQLAFDGQPVDALRHLRADFDAIRQEDIEQQHIDEPEPTAAATVTGVSVTDTSGGTLTTITPGDALLVNVDIAVDGTVHDPVIGIGIDSMLGQVVYGTNTKLMGATLAPLSGQSRHTFKLPAVRLGEGQYTVYAAIARDGGVELNRLRDGASLRVHAKGRGIGFISVDTELVT